MKFSSIVLNQQNQQNDGVMCILSPSNYGTQFQELINLPLGHSQILHVRPLQNSINRRAFYFFSFIFGSGEDEKLPKHSSAFGGRKGK